MSIDIDIFPSLIQIPTWGQVKETWLTYLIEDIREVIGENPTLKILGNHQVVEDSDVFIFGMDYLLELKIRNRLGIAVEKNGEYIDPRAYLEGYGRNLTSETLKSYIEQWNSTEYYFEVTSTIGRTKHESLLMVALVSAIAKVCNGGIILMNDGLFDLNVGVYTPEQFLAAKPKF